MRGTTFLLTGLPLIVSLGGTITAAILLQMSWIIFLYPVLLFPLAILGGRRYNADLKRARLEADSQTSSVIGKDALLQVMKKIDMMGLDDIDRLKSGRGGRRLASLPSITERIDNLQGLSSLASFSSILVDGLRAFAAFLKSSTNRRAASASGGAVLLRSFRLVLESFDKTQHSKEQCYTRYKVHG